MDDIKTFLKERLDLRLLNMPANHHGSEIGPVYLALVLDGDVIATINGRQLRAVIEEKEDPWA